MAKVVTKSYEELLISEEEAKRITEDKLKPDDLSLPYTIHHQDGMWVGTLKDIATVSLQEVVKQKFFLTEENKLRFHNTHGYGKYQDKYEPSYGLLDVQTQYLIGAGVAKLTQDSFGRKALVTLSSPEYDKYSDYWKDYLTKLDPFNELR